MQRLIGNATKQIPFPARAFRTASLSG